MSWDKEDLQEALLHNPDLGKVNPSIGVREIGVCDMSGDYVSSTLISNSANAGSSPASATKHHSQRTGHYQSKKEAQYAADLAIRKQAGEVAFWLEQVSFPLPGIYTDKRGRKKQAVHRLDFVVFSHMMDWTGSHRLRPLISDFVEVKGFKTPMGELKRKQVEAIYGIQIKVV